MGSQTRPYPAAVQTTSTCSLLLVRIRKAWAQGHMARLGYFSLITEQNT